MPLRAAGQCLLRYYLDGKQQKENFPVKLWINPPNEIYLQGDVAFDASGLVLGANADEFWFWLKPKEISSYWWGSWSQDNAAGRFALNSSALLEAFGSVDFQNGNWSLTQSSNFDVLIMTDEQGTILKRVYIDSCDYLVSKIEYLDSAGRFGRAEFADYEIVDENFSVPRSIKVIMSTNDAGENSVLITLASVKLAQFSQQQRNRLFVRPQPRGFAHIYTIINGKVIEQKSE